MGADSPGAEGGAGWAWGGGAGAHVSHGNRLVREHAAGLGPAGGEAFDGGAGWLGGDRLGTAQTAWVGLMGFMPLLDL